MNKKRINGNGILIYTLSKMRAYCSMFHNFSIFSTSDEGLFLCFGVSNVPNIWHLTHLRDLMIVLLGVKSQKNKNVNINIPPVLKK